MKERGCPRAKGVIIALNAEGDGKAGRRTRVEQSGWGEEGAPPETGQQAQGMGHRVV